ncbi:hypothetical protein M407DRAFT_23848 [Tulasnella calospora MUT 4182]|uniref:Uncharacterized protein n=1 Tax=Tulasnella calospora MUT 4182 TaxID=1051891 RepID=A0A0C3QKI0_9AGAM|nr:hypothetical protein M407DRAFT_23848 [Tulasnella calospora MUT 4182]
MADFAATCLETGALRWWSGLNQEVQGSWNLLRRAMFSRYRPLFHGGSGEEAENFIRAVWDKAIDEEKQEDNKWMAMYALSCLAGEGLRWYASLDSDTQENWKKLQQAVLVQYPRDTPDGALPNTIPSPAAASAPNVTRRGRIRLSNSSSTTPHYISKKYSSNEKRISSTSSLADALEFEWNPGSGNQHMLSIPNSQFPGYDVLGLRWCAKIPKGERDLSNFLSLCAVDSQTKSTAFSSVSGDVVIDAWKVSRQGTSGALAVSVLVDGVFGICLQSKVEITAKYNPRKLPAEAVGKV